MTENRVLILEDDYDLAALMKRTFEKEGYIADCYTGGRNYSERISAFKPDLILLDLMLPEVDGISICRWIKTAHLDREIKVIMLTAKSEEADILIGYESGVDDYVTKPFSPREVVARAKAVLRRKQSRSSLAKNKLIKRGQLTIDDARYQMSVSEKPLELTHSEYRILRALATQPKRVYTREQLAESVVSDDNRSPKITGSRNIDVHIQSLRKKLGDFSDYIKTKRGVGYTFNAD